MVRDTEHYLTTHANWGEGAPRLLLHADGIRGEFALTHPVTRIGSAPDDEIRFSGLDDTHAIVRHTDDDEYVLTLYGVGTTTANPDPDGTGRTHDIVLRTGAQFSAGPYVFVFQREEFADHGRPHGGRQGGELSDQPPQPRRPHYREGETANTPRPPEQQAD